MKKRIRIILILAALFSVKTKAENPELNRLVEIVHSLQTGGASAYKAAISKLARDKQWTPMDEIPIDRESECRVSDRVAGFRLNSVLTNAENAERYQTTTGNHLNGSDSRYNYSLYEKTLKAGHTARFSLSGRWGEQEFIVIPFQGAEANLKATIKSGGRQFTSSEIGNGGIKLSGIAEKGRPVQVEIVNEGATPVSYVILNYNSRK